MAAVTFHELFKMAAADAVRRCARDTSPLIIAVTAVTAVTTVG